MLDVDLSFVRAEGQRRIDVHEEVSTGATHGIDDVRIYPDGADPISRKTIDREQSECPRQFGESRRFCPGGGFASTGGEQQGKQTKGARSQ